MWGRDKEVRSYELAGTSRPYGIPYIEGFGRYGRP